MPPLLLLGPQQPRPNLGDGLAALGARGPLSVITAGWQEREGELEPLGAHLKRSVTDLALYRRVLEIFAADEELLAAHRERQRRLKIQQRWYRRRLQHYLRACEELVLENEDGADLATEQRSALNTLRSLDRHHLRRTRDAHARFEARARPLQRACVDRHRRELADLIEDSAAVLIAGGHIAVLLNRMRLLGVGELIRDKPIIAWSAGAMALADRIVLFNDVPPQGAGHAELLDTGLGFYPGMVALPHARTRLKLDDPRRVGLLARRFAPARCITLDAGARIRIENGHVTHVQAVARLRYDGTLGTVETR
jgi:peptidase E